MQSESKGSTAVHMPGNSNNIVPIIPTIFAFRLNTVHWILMFVLTLTTSNNYTCLLILPQPCAALLDEPVL